MKKSFFLSVILMMFWLASSGDGWTQAAPQVKTDRDTYSTGEAIRIGFAGAPGSNRDWICIVAAEALDDDAGDYQYLPASVSQGQLTFNAPAPGKYEVRAYYDYSRHGYKVSARHSFEVKDKSSAVLPAKQNNRKPEAKQPEERQTGKTLPAEGPRSNIAVFHFTPLNVEATSISVTATNMLANNPKIQAAFDVFNKKDMEVFLSANNLLQNNDLNNIINIGSILGLNFIIAGNMEKRGSNIFTTCLVAHIARKTFIFRKKFASGGEADLSNNLSKMSDEIIQAIARNR